MTAFGVDPVQEAEAEALDRFHDISSGGELDVAIGAEREGLGPKHVCSFEPAIEMWKERAAA